MIKLANVRDWSAARERLSRNANSRNGKDIVGVVLHATGGSDEGSESWMANPESQVSCHLHFRRDGSTTRMVEDVQRAWHAGKGEWRGHTDVNGVTLGWEIGNFNNGVEKFTDAQYAELAHVAVHYIRQGLTLEDFFGGPPLHGDFTSHAQVALPRGRKNDPVGFDWERFRRETKARLEGKPVQLATVPHKVWSDYFGEHLIVLRFINDEEWYFMQESQVMRASGILRGQTPLSEMPPAKN